jgi:hypothetical protein
MGMEEAIGSMVHQHCDGWIKCERDLGEIRTHCQPALNLPQLFDSTSAPAFGIQNRRSSPRPLAPRAKMRRQTFLNLIEVSKSRSWYILRQEEDRWCERSSQKTILF